MTERTKAHSHGGLWVTRLPSTSKEMPNFWRNVIIKNDKWSIINLFLVVDYSHLTLALVRSLGRWRIAAWLFSSFTVIICFSWSERNSGLFDGSRSVRLPFEFDLMFLLMLFSIIQLIISSFRLWLDSIIYIASFCVFDCKQKTLSHSRQQKKNDRKCWTFPISKRINWIKTNWSTHIIPNDEITWRRQLMLDRCVYVCVLCIRSETAMRLRLLQIANITAINNRCNNFTSIWS